MHTVKGIYKDGQIVLDVPTDWPEGTEVLVEPILTEDEVPPTPEEIAQRLALMDQIQPLILTPEEESEWEKAREAQQSVDKSEFEERAKKLRGTWE